MKPWLINLKRVFVNKKYVFIAILIGAIFYLLNVFISEFSFILQEFRLRGFFQSFNLFLVSIMNFANVVEFYSLSSVILIGLLCC